MASEITFCATGDSFITRRLPSRSEPGFRDLAGLIGRAEARFTNLETVIRREEGAPAAVSGGTWASSDPRVLDDLGAYGFNAFNWATNHTLDYGEGGLEATRRYLEEAGLLSFGAGRDLAEAAAPRYLDCPSGRVAFLGATLTFHESARAGASRPGCPGRPGVNAVRVDRSYLVPRERLALLREIAEGTGISDAQNLSQKEGFLPPPPEGALRFGAAVFREGEKLGQEARVAEADRQRLLTAIAEAARQADVVLVSLHCHETVGLDKAVTPAFLADLARACIDGGAHGVLGHGPHVLRAVEIYRDRPIFYSLGNFIFQNETVATLPADFYEKHRIDPARGVAEAFDARSRNGAVGLGTNPHVWESVVASWSMAEGRLRALTLHPIELGWRLPRHARGWPTPATGEAATAILERLGQLSRPYDTQWTFRDGAMHLEL